MPSLASRRMPAPPAHAPQIVYAAIRTRAGEIPDSLADSSSPPSAYTCTPKRVARKTSSASAKEGSNTRTGYGIAPALFDYHGLQVGRSASTRELGEPHRPPARGRPTGVGVVRRRRPLREAARDSAARRIEGSNPSLSGAGAKDLGDDPDAVLDIVCAHDQRRIEENGCGSGADADARREPALV
jgi:hypothetical protein